MTARTGNGFLAMARGSGLVESPGDVPGVGGDRDGFFGVVSPRSRHPIESFRSRVIIFSKYFDKTLLPLPLKLMAFACFILPRGRTCRAKRTNPFHISTQ